MRGVRGRRRRRWEARQELAEAIAPGVWWLHGTRGSNVFLAETEAGALALFDTGFGSSFQGIIDDVDAVRPGARVTHVFLTHHHLDHTGAAAALRRHYGALLVAGAADCALDDDNGNHLLRPHVGPSHRVRRLLRGLLRWQGSARPVPVDRPLYGEVEVAGIRAIPTPGHTPGSYCYLLPDRDLAFLGDLVLSHGDAVSRPMRSANDDDAEYMQSLEAFARRAPGRGCPGHGPVIGHDLRQQLLLLTTMERTGGFSPARIRRRARRLAAFGWSMTRERRARPSRGDDGHRR